jgi:autotransporter passenger strand-loop-strand repeat protein
MSDYVVNSGQTVSGMLVGDDDYRLLYVDAGGTAVGTTVFWAGTMFVEYGGTDINTAVISNGDVEDSGTASGTTVSDGYENVDSGGTAISSTVGSSGIENVAGGGQPSAPR